MKPTDWKRLVMVMTPVLSFRVVAPETYALTTAAFPAHNNTPILHFQRSLQKPQPIANVIKYCEALPRLFCLSSLAVCNKALMAQFFAHIQISY
jgi:hypothetical protein